MVLDEKITILQRILWLINTLFHKLLAIVTFLILWILFENNKSNNKTLWHAFWSTIAYIPLMAEGLVLFSEANSSTFKLKRGIKYYLHLTLLAAALITVTVGIVIEYQSKERFHGRHFMSKHSKLGLASWILCFISSLSGMGAFFSTTLKSFIPPVYPKLFHNLTGLAAYTTGIASLIVGFDYRMISGYVSSDTKTFLVYCTSVATVYSVLEAIRSLYHQLRSLF